MEKVSIASKLSQFSDHWNPRIVGELNGQHVKLVKFQGEFVWHHHVGEDELFLVVEGRFPMDFRDRQVWLERATSSSCHGALSIVLLPTTKCQCSCSSRQEH